MMDKIFPQLLFLLLFVAYSNLAESGVGGRSSQSAPRPYYMHPYHPYRGTNYKGGPLIYGGLHPYSPQKAATVPEVKKSGGHGLSAWGIVGIILAIIFCGTGIYYCGRFYPIFCKKERNDNFEL
ncbi:hypothetical protein J437_LFUL011022 [Ladona fulva]|uniref:Transmembrane protein n=1 Tax=Ladona fulva TaxID=123851 RepID=A0A8K0KCY6_LADFU|nr:hypothetical protein J437_LFUL011022 [Ladona fulva]